MFAIAALPIAGMNYDDGTHWSNWEKHWDNIGD